MNKEKQRIAIAEACGWVFRDGGNFAGVAQKLVEPLHGRLTHIMTHKAAIRSTPDYLNDLNAMHQAEMVLSRGEHYNQTGGFGLYVENLGLVRCGRLHLIEATAAQRAEAFLRTIGKWEDDE
jgi:hypothetical protein